MQKKTFTGPLLAVLILISLFSPNSYAQEHDFSLSEESVNRLDSLLDKFYQAFDEILDLEVATAALQARE